MIFQTLKKSGLPVAYGKFRKEQSLPYVVYTGSGQLTSYADDTLAFRKNEYQIELYFKKKNETVEQSLEDVLIADGFNYEKSEDTYIDAEDVYVIYYTV